MFCLGRCSSACPRLPASRQASPPLLAIPQHLQRGLYLPGSLPMTSHHHMMTRLLPPTSLLTPTCTHIQTHHHTTTCHTMTCCHPTTNRHHTTLLSQYLHLASHCCMTLFPSILLCVFYICLLLRVMRKLVKHSVVRAVLPLGPSHMLPLACLTVRISLPSQHLPLILSN